MKKYLGLLLIILGALMLVLSYFADFVDYNWYQVLALFLIIAGLVAHINIAKRLKK